MLFLTLSWAAHAEEPAPAAPPVVPAEVPAADVPAAEVPAADVPAAEVPAPEVPAEPPPDPSPPDPSPPDPSPPDPSPPDPIPLDPTGPVEPVAAEPAPERATTAVAALEEAAATRTVDRIAATVNDDLLALSEVWAIGRDFVKQNCAVPTPECVRDAELQVLDTLVRRSLVEQELKRLDLEVTAQDVDQAIDSTVQQYGMADRQALRDEVERSGKRWDEYREEIKEFLRTRNFQQRVLAPRVSVTEDELRDAYQRVARKVKTQVATVSAIGQQIDTSSPDQIGAQIRQMFELAQFLRAGEITWDAAVTEYDRGLSGLLGNQEFTEDSLIDALKEPVFHRPVGEIQNPVQFQSANGAEIIAILRVDTLVERSEALPFEEVRDQLEQQVFSEKVEAAEEEWYQRARREAAVVIHL